MKGSNVVAKDELNINTHNLDISASNINIDVANDALFKGATLRANDTLNLNVGNNLDVISLQDEYTYSNKGFNVSAGVGFGGTNANIDVKNNTHLIC
ncbi:hemagglutinin repeat-containing protein [Campylobacter pinnipediorum]|uniref:hemagglutinin repeat-containing protein n=1 Tax=Campylobacter pinnipediorum TaxID=1965231 RepID=UPI003AAE4A9B